MNTALFQHIPRCLFEPFAVLGAIGVILFLIQHWRKEKAETLLLGAAFLFMLGWRLCLPIRADRYALILIPVAILASLFAIEKIVVCCRWYCPFPGSRWWFGLLLIVCLVKTFHRSTEDRQMFELMKCLRRDAGDAGRKIRVVTNRDLVCFFGDGVEIVLTDEDFLQKLADLPAADYYLMKLKSLPQDREAPQFVRLLALRQARCGKADFILWKRVRK